MVNWLTLPTPQGTLAFISPPTIRRWSNEPSARFAASIEPASIVNRYPSPSGAPFAIVSPEAAAATGLLPGPGWSPSTATLVAAPAPLTREQIRAVKDAAAGYPGVYIQTLEDFLPRLGPVRLAATAGAAVIALVIVGVVVGLVGAEARRDQAILVAVGASPRARRRIAAARAGLVALLAGVIAVPAGFAPVAVIQWSRVVYGPAELPDRYPIVVPWSTMALVALAVPLVAALFATTTSRAPKASAMLQPIH